MFRKILLTSIMGLIFSATLYAQHATDRKELKAYRLTQADNIRLDGRVNEPVWNRIGPATGFRMQEPREGDEATESTEM